MRPRKTVLVVTPSEMERDLYAMRLQLWGYAADLAPSCVDAAAQLRYTLPFAVLCDGVDEASIRVLAAINPEVPLIVIGNTGQQRDRLMQAARAAKTPIGVTRTQTDFPCIIREVLRIAVACKRGPKTKTSAEPAAQERAA